MKKLIISIILIAGFISAYSQTDDPTKYIWYKNTYGQRLPRVWGDTVMRIPTDTSWSKAGIAAIGTTLYIANGIKWFPITGGGGGNPFADNTDLVKGGTTASKILRLNVEANVSSSTTITDTIQNRNLTITGQVGTLPSYQRAMTDGNGLITTQAEIVHQPVKYATSVTLPANTYNNGTSGLGRTLTANANGALTVNGNSVSVGDRILVMFEATAANNGVYTVTQVGDASHPYILTGGNFSSIAANIAAQTEVSVTSGIFTGQTFKQQTTGAITIGTSPLIYRALSTAKFYVDAFAKGDGVTDDTQAIQATIQACHDAGGGDVIFGPYTYLISGAIQTSFMGLDYNSQLCIPWDTITTNAVTIRLIGVAPGWTPSIGISPLGTTIPAGKGTVLYSTYSGTRASTNPGTAVIASEGPNTVFGKINYNTTEFFNINIKVKNNPNGAGPEIGGIRCAHVLGFIADNILAFVDTSGNALTLPARKIVGIELPENGKGAQYAITNSATAGYRYGFLLGEHAYGNNLNAYECYVGYGFKWQTHSSYFGRISADWCQIGANIYDDGTAQQDMYIDVDEFDLEYGQGNAGGLSWINTVFGIKDSLNRIHGHWNYFSGLQSAGGASLSTFNMSGGGYIDTTAIGTQRWTLSSGKLNTNYPLVINSNGGNTEVINATASSNARYGAYFRNTNATAQADVLIENDRGSFASYGQFAIVGSTNTFDDGTFGLTHARDWALLFSAGASNLGLAVGTLNSAPVLFGTNNAERARLLSTGEFVIGGTSGNARFNIAGNQTKANNGVNGTAFSIAAATYTDNSTASSGTVTHTAAYSFGRPTFNTTNSTTTYTIASTVYIDNAPTTGGNVALTNPYALYINAGNTLMNGDLTLGTAGNALRITEGTNGRVGQTTLVAGTKAITITGLTTSSRAIVTLVSQSGTTTTTAQYAGVCTANTLTINAVTSAGTNTLNTSDNSIVNYFIIN